MANETWTGSIWEFIRELNGMIIREWKGNEWNEMYLSKGMEWNEMYLSKGKEWNEMELSNLDWMF